MAKKRIAVVKAPNGIHQLTFPNIIVQRKNVYKFRKMGLKVVTGTYDTKSDSPGAAFKKLRARL